MTSALKVVDKEYLVKRCVKIGKWKKELEDALTTVDSDNFVHALIKDQLESLEEYWKSLAFSLDVVTGVKDIDGNWRK